MRFNTAVLIFCLVLAFIAPGAAIGQEEPPPRQITAASGLLQFDFARDGVTPMLAVRAGTPVSTVLLLEGSLVAARPGQRFGTSTFLVPEAQVHLSLPFTGFTPYFGLGFGGILDLRDDADGGTRTTMTISGSLGLRAWLWERTGLVGEYRARGIGTDFEDTSAEYTIGLSYRL